MRDLPPIAPTGAMSSGDYVSYMMGYDDSAEDVVIDNLTEFGTMQTMEDWYVLWGRMLDEVSSRVTTIEDDIKIINRQIKIINLQIDGM